MAKNLMSIKKMTDLNVVGKANLLIESRHELNEIEQRLVLLAIAKARSTGYTVEQLVNKELEIHASDYMKAYNVERQTAYDVLKKAVMGLYEAQWSYRFINKKGALSKHLFYYAKTAVKVLETQATNDSPVDNGAHGQRHDG